MLPMANLRDFFSQLGFDDAQTLLQTGNVVFTGPAKSTTSFEALFETEATKRLKLTTAFMVRTASEWKALVTANPFPAMARNDPSHLLVMFLKDPAGAKEVKALQAAIKGPEQVRAKGKQAYITYTEGIGRSKLTNAMLERTLGTSSTGRNWNTVLKLAALAGVA